MDIKKDMQSRTAMSQQTTAGMESFSISLGKKCERLATALYLVTSFLSDTEPLKSRLRTLSLDFVRDASYVRYGTIAVETNVLEGLRANIGETLALLELALIAGLVSEMNFSILKREYVSLRGMIDIKKASRESRTDTILGDTFFGSSFTEEKSRPNFIQQNDLLGGMPLKGRSGNLPAHHYPQGHSIGQKDTTMSDRPTHETDQSQAVTSSSKTPKGHAKKEAVAPIPESVDSRLGRNSKSSYIPNSIEKDSRRTRILKLIKDNREVTIKDIATYFPELSEKTIQRELVSLTEEGTLKKFGERRWSRYTLA